MAPPTEAPMIQVLEKEHYFTQALVTLPPPAGPATPLAPSSVRLRTRLLGLSVNNFTYAKLGAIAHYWDAVPLPGSTPAPYGDVTRYGRLGAWGWAEVVASTHAGVAAGALLWGYQAVGTQPQDLAVRDDGALPGHLLLVTSPFRQKLLPLYNRYFVARDADADAVRREIDGRGPGPAYDAIVRIMFETAYLMNRFPLERPEGATFVLLAPGSKVGLCFARELRRRGAGDKAARVVGAAGEQSMAFVEGTGLYDAVVSTSGSPVEVLAGMGVADREKVVLVDFGGRADVGAKWAAALKPVYDFKMLTVGFEISEASQADVLAGLGASGAVSKLVNMGELLAQAVEVEGEEQYYKNLQFAWESFRTEGIRGLKMRWGTGMEDVKKAWDELAKGEVKPSEGLVFTI